jgi:hypothetical protein
MDDPFRHLSHFSREGKVLPRVFGVYEERQKRGWVDKTFGSVNVSLLLKGKGVYSDGRTTWAVRAPCVFWQMPEVCTRYGPEGSWWEFSLIYLEAERGRLRRALGRDGGRMINADAGVLPRWLEAAGRVREAAAGCGKRQGTAEVVDALALALVLEVTRAVEMESAASAADPLTAMRQKLESVGAATPNLDELAREHGLSPASFRRKWAERFAVSPLNYHLQHRMEEACRLLRTTRLSLAEVAAATGFEDVLYFSRRFSARIGEPPGAYRERMKMGIGE